MIQRIGVLTSGGDAPGMNACIRAVVRAALDYGLEVVGIRRGYHGLVDRDMVKLNRRQVAGIIHRGGTILESSRCEEFKTPEGRAKAIEIMKQEGIEALVVIGGEGSFKGASALSEESEIKVVGIPGTIDNDIAGTDYTIGFDTAVNTAIEAIDRIRDTAESLKRVFFVEVMGRRSGSIALEVGIAAGAEETLLPEFPGSIEGLCHKLKESFKRGKRSSIVIVAEGNGGGGTVEIAHMVGKRLGVDCRVCVLGHIQRGGAPTARDRVLATKMGVAGVEALLQGRDGNMIGEAKGQIVHVPLHLTSKLDKGLSQDSLALLRVMGF